jgi:CheY-like chemotaxis protein
MHKLPVSKILYADDDVDDRFFLSESLSSNGMNADLVFVRDGEEAIDYLNCTQPDDLPALILLDLNMPRKNGRQTLDYIKTHPTFSSIPVVILSTSDNYSDIDFCVRHGASSYLKKPIHYKGYDDIVKNISSFVDAIVS